MKNVIEIKWKNGEGLLQRLDEKDKVKAFKEAQRIANDNPMDVVLVTRVKEKVLKEFKAMLVRTMRAGKQVP